MAFLQFFGRCLELFRALLSLDSQSLFVGCMLVSFGFWLNVSAVLFLVFRKRVTRWLKTAR